MKGAILMVGVNVLIKKAGIERLSVPELIWNGIYLPGMNTMIRFPGIILEPGFRRSCWLERRGKRLSEEGGAGMRKEKQGRARNGTDEQGEVGSSRGW